MIEPRTVEAVAHLARIEVPKDGLASLAEKIGNILDYVEQLKELDVSGVEPLTHASADANVYREDTVRPSLPSEDVLACAPVREGAFYRVPKVIGDA